MTSNDEPIRFKATESNSQEYYERLKEKRDKEFKEELERVNQRFQQWEEGTLHPDPEIEKNNAPARIMLFDLKKSINTFKYRDNKHTDLHDIVKDLDDRFFTALRLGVIKEGNTKDDKIKEFEKQLSERELKVKDLEVQLKDEKEKADFWKEKYETLRDSQNQKKFRGSLGT